MEQNGGTIVKTMVLFIFILTLTLQSQNNQLLKEEITLEEVLKIASKNSLDAFKAKRQIEYSYWEYKSFKASLLPEITFTAKPFTYRSTVVEVYDSGSNQFVFRPIQSLNSSSNVSLSQNILQTGGRISLNSNYNQLFNYNNGLTKSYSATPVNISLNQPLMAFNSFKWNKKIAPLTYQKAEKDLTYELQSINVKATQYFFTWALAAKKHEMAKEKMITSKTLYDIGEKRYNIGSIEKADLLNLELQLYDSEIELSTQHKNLVEVKNDLTIYLRKDLTHVKSPILPELIPSLKIDINNAMEIFKKNNPNILELEITKIESERDLDQTIKGNRFDLSLSASYGFNQQSDALATVYQNLLEQELVSINFSIPILDWGERKGNIKKARMNKKVTDIVIEQEKSKLHQEMSSKVRDFNLQERLVLSALRANEISRESYVLTEKRFLEGRVDLLRLTSSLNTWQTSNERYMSKLSNYWRYYYEIQQYTLYDFQEKRELKVDFEKGILN